MKNNSLWKKILVCLMMAAVLFSMAGCAKKEDEKPAENVETEEKATSSVPKSVKIDYKSSELYSKEDMDAAIELIMQEFNNWKGCEMHEITFTDDKMCKDNLSYINELATDEEFVDCIVFLSSFHSPKKGGDAWQADYEYEGWQWYLGRTKDGDWNLLTWGY